MRYETSNLSRLLRCFAAILIACLLTGASVAATAKSPDDLDIITVSTRPDTVSGGDVLVRIVAPPPVSEVRFDQASGGSGDTLIERRPAWFGQPGAFVDTPVYARARLREGDEIAGPALIEESESTAVIGPGAMAAVDRFGNLIMRL